MDRVTNKQLETLVDWINKTTNSPVESYVKSDNGCYKAQPGNYHLGEAYGGVTLYRMINASGSTANIFGNGYMPKRDIANSLYAFIRGIEAGKEIVK